MLEQIANGIDQLNDWVGRQVSWLNTILVALVCVDVFIRYFLSDSSAWIMELEWHLFAAIFLLGAGYAFQHDRHVRVDLFYTNMSKRDQALVDFIGTLLFLVPWCLVLIYVSYRYAWQSFIIRESSPDPGGLSARYVVKFLMSIGLFLLLLQAVSKLIRTGLTLRDTRNNDTE